MVTVAYVAVSFYTNHNRNKNNSNYCQLYSGDGWRRREEGGRTNETER